MVMSTTPVTHEAAVEGQHQEAPGLSVLLYSNNREVRDTVRLGVGDRPAPDVRIARWQECATPDAVILEVQDQTFDLLILDGESQPYGGLGISRELKNSIFDCPPILVLTGRPVDGWLATWSMADAAVPRPLDAERLATTVAELARR